MDIASYFGNLFERYSIYYNTSKDVVILNENVDIMAEFKDVHGRTFLSSKDVIDSYEINEICYVKRAEKVDILSLSNYTDFLKKAVDVYVQPKRGHMCTYITGVLVTENHLEDDLISSIKKFKYSKSFFFSLHGWCEIRLLVINPEKEQIITNKPGKKVIKFYNFR